MNARREFLKTTGKTVAAVSIAPGLFTKSIFTGQPQKNITIGIIGAENSHSYGYGRMFNTDKKFPGVEVKYIWGETDEFAKVAMERGNIPNQVKDPAEMMGKIDALIVDHRHPKYHLEPAIPFVKAGIPTFIDKPFSLTVEEALAIANNSLTHKVPILGGSTLCFDPQIQQKVTHSPTPKLAIIAYQADDDSPFGGYRFYGSHLTDLCSIIFNDQPLSVRSNNSGESITTTVRYLHNIGILHSTPNSSKPQVMMSTNHSLILFVLDDEHCYYYGMQAFIQLIEKGEPDKQHLQRLISSVNILDAVMRSLDTGKEIKITEQHI